MNGRVRIIKIAIFATLALIVTMTAVDAFFFRPAPAPPSTIRIARDLTDAERRWSKKQMKKHGITSFFCTLDGECYFTRNGQRCRL